MDLGSLHGVQRPGGYDQTGKPVRKKPAAGKKPEAGSSERSSKLDSVRERMKAGYYKSEKVDEAISDKISGAFDRLA